MRKSPLLIALAMLLLLPPAVSSAGGDVYTKYTFPNIVWTDQEKEGFAIFDRGAQIGDAEVWIKEIEYFDQTAYMIEYIENSDDYTERTVTKVSANGLKPLAVTKRIEIGDDVWYYEANYTGDMIQLSYQTPENPYKEKMSMSAGLDFHSSEILPYMLRNLTFKTGDLYTFTLLGAETMHYQSAIVEVMGEEIVEVPSGVYDCYKIEIRQAGVTYEAWYSKKPPQYLIKYYFGKEMGMKNHT